MIQNLKNEIWKVVPKFDNYEVSNFGRVKSYSKKGIPSLICHPKEGRYSKITFCKNGVKESFSLHRIVCELFLPNPFGYPIINHKNGIVSDNRVENLEWCTYSHNNKHAYRELGRKVVGIGGYGKANHKSKRVFVFNTEGEFVDTYESACLAATHLKLMVSAIRGCCLGIRASHKGYIFREANGIAPKNIFKGRGTIIVDKYDLVMKSKGE